MANKPANRLPIDNIAGGVTSSGVLADNALIRGDGGVRGVQASGIIVNDTDDISARNLTAGALTAARVVFTGANGLLSEEAGFAWITADKRLDITKTALIDTPTGGLRLINTEAALDGERVQVSPPAIWEGRGWSTADAGASMAVVFRAFARPITGVAAPTGAWDLQASINGGAYSSLLSVLSNGSLGVNCVDPQSEIEVRGTAEAYVLARATGVNSRAGFLAQNDVRTWNIGIDSSDHFRFMDATALTVPFLIEGTAPTGSFKIESSGDVCFEAVAGNVGIGTNIFQAAAVWCLAIANGTEPAAHTDNQIYIYSKDSVGSAGATLGFTTESPVVVHDAGGAWTISHKWFVWIDGAEYSISLDAV